MGAGARVLFALLLYAAAVVPEGAAVAAHGALLLREGRAYRTSVSRRRRMNAADAVPDSSESRAEPAAAAYKSIESSGSAEAATRSSVEMADDSSESGRRRRGEAASVAAGILSSKKSGRRRRGGEAAAAVAETEAAAVAPESVSSKESSRRRRGQEVAAAAPAAEAETVAPQSVLSKESRRRRRGGDAVAAAPQRSSEGRRRRRGVESAASEAESQVVKEELAGALAVTQDSEVELQPLEAEKPFNYMSSDDKKDEVEEEYKEDNVEQPQMQLTEARVAPQLPSPQPPMDETGSQAEDKPLPEKRERPKVYYTAPQTRTMPAGVPGAGLPIDMERHTPYVPHSQQGAMGGAAAELASDSSSLEAMKATVESLVRDPAEAAVPAPAMAPQAPLAPAAEQPAGSQTVAQLQPPMVAQPQMAEQQALAQSGRALEPQLVEPMAAPQVPPQIAAATPSLLAQRPALRGGALALLQRSAGVPPEIEAGRERLLPLYMSANEDEQAALATVNLNLEEAPGHERMQNITLHPPSNTNYVKAPWTALKGGQFKPGDPNGTDWKAQFEVTSQGSRWITTARRKQLKAGDRAVSDREWLATLRMWNLSAVEPDEDRPDYDQVWPWKYAPGASEWDSFRIPDHVPNEWPYQPRDASAEPTPDPMTAYPVGYAPEDAYTRRIILQELAPGKVDTVAAAAQAVAKAM